MKTELLACGGMISFLFFSFLFFSFFLSLCYLMTMSASMLYSVSDKMIKEYGAIGGMRIGRRN
jgi:hypothetical protein